MTLDDDVAAALERLRRFEDKSLKDVVNQALRLGIEQLKAPPKPRQPFRTRPVSLGPCLIGDVVSVSEAIALGEGEDHK